MDLLFILIHNSSVRGRTRGKHSSFKLSKQNYGLLSRAPVPTHRGGEVEGGGNYCLLLLVLVVEVDIHLMFHPVSHKGSYQGEIKCIATACHIPMMTHFTVHDWRSLGENEVE